MLESAGELAGSEHDAGSLCSPGLIAAAHPASFRVRRHCIEGVVVGCVRAVRVGERRPIGTLDP